MKDIANLLYLRHIGSNNWSTLINTTNNRRVFVRILTLLTHFNHFLLFKLTLILLLYFSIIKVSLCLLVAPIRWPNSIVAIRSIKFVLCVLSIVRRALCFLCVLHSSWRGRRYELYFRLMCGQFHAVCGCGEKVVDHGHGYVAKVTRGFRDGVRRHLKTIWRARGLARHVQAVCRVVNLTHILVARWRNHSSLLEYYFLACYCSKIRENFANIARYNINSLQKSWTINLDKYIYLYNWIKELFFQQKKL